jgi:hypothetical protein
MGCNSPRFTQSPLLVEALAVLDENATLTGGDVLPGFSLPLAPFFAKPRKKRKQ